LPIRYLCSLVSDLNHPPQFYLKEGETAQAGCEPVLQMGAQFNSLTPEVLTTDISIDAVGWT